MRQSRAEGSKRCETVIAQHECGEGLISRCIRLARQAKCLRSILNTFLACSERAERGFNDNRAGAGRAHREARAQLAEVSCGAKQLNRLPKEPRRTDHIAREVVGERDQIECVCYALLIVLALKDLQGMLVRLETLVNLPGVDEPAAQAIQTAGL